jgi:quercetin dioxygenase-like cupin family protein
MREVNIVKIPRTLAVIAALLVPLMAISATGSATMAAGPGPTVPFQNSYPISVEAGDYDLLYLVLDFAPGAGIPLHYHGGPAAVVGMEGELTLRPHDGPERKLMPTDVVNEKAGAHHVMLNTSSANARILAVILLPKDKEVTTVVDTETKMPGPTVPFQGSYPITAIAGEYDLVNLVLDFAPGAEIPLHFHGGPAVVVGMDGQLTLRPQGAAEKKLNSGDVVQEKAGAIHQMINTSNTNARILAGVLLPKGVELTTLLGTQPAGMPTTGSNNALDPVLPVLIVSLLFLGVGGGAYRMANRKRRS